MKQVKHTFFKMRGGLFSFCFLHGIVFGNGQLAITHNGIGLGEVAEPKAKLKNKS